MKKTNIVFSGLAAAFAIAVFIVTKSLPPSTGGVPGPAVFPRIVAGIILCCSIAVFVKAILCETDENRHNFISKDSVRVYATMLSLFAYFAAMRYLGFIIDTAVMLTCFFCWYSKKRVWVCVLIAIITSLVVFTVFSKGLNVSLKFGVLYF